MRKIEREIRQSLNFDLISRAEVYFKTDCISASPTKAVARHKYFEILRRIYKGADISDLCLEINVSENTMFEMIKSAKNRVEMFRNIENETKPN